MKKKQVYSLCEAVADITYIAAKENYRIDHSCEIISQFIQWAKEFERLHQHIKWGCKFSFGLHRFNLLFYLVQNKPMA